MITYIVWRLFSILLFVVSVELWYLRRERHSNDDPAKWVTFPVDCDWWTNLQVTEGVQTARLLIQSMPCHVPKVWPLWHSVLVFLYIFRLVCDQNLMLMLVWNNMEGGVAGE